MTSKKKAANKLYVLIFLFFLLLVGSFLRFYNLDHIILYWDEPLHCIRIAYQPLPFVLAYNNASAFFALLVHLLLPLGKIEMMARLPSALFGIMSIVAVYFLGKFIFSKKEGLAAAAFITFSPFLIRYSQYSRPYSAYIFFSILSFYFFLKAVKENKKIFWIAYCLITAVNIYTHLFAFLLIPVYALYAGVLWITGRKKSKGKKGYGETKILKKYILWTLLLLILVFLLYLPDETARSFFLGSIERAKTQPSETSISFSLINDILMNQIEARNLFYYLTFLFFAFFGLISSPKKQAKKNLFLLICMFLPFLAFIAIRPREVNILSADRYFIFILPLFLLLTARGITSCSSLAASVFSRIKFVNLNKNLSTNIISALLLIILIGGGFNLKHYYLNFWRFGSLRVKKEVRDCLQKNVKEDSLIFFDFFPASSLITVVNPLTKNSKKQEIEFIIRDNLEVFNDKNKVMIYRISQGVFEWFVHKDIALWVVTKLDSEKHKKLFTNIKEFPEIKAINLKNHTVLHFQRNSKPLSEKMSTMAKIFLSLNLAKAKEKEFRLLAARAYLLNNKFEEAYQEIKMAKNIVLKPSEARISESPFVFQVLDKIFGLNPLELRQRGQDYFLETGLARRLYRQGNRFFAQKEYGKASRAYSECLDLSEEDYNLKISKKLVLIGDRYFSRRNPNQAITFYKKALQLNPKRYDINFLLAESYRQGGLLQLAREEYRKTFNLDALSSETFHKIARSPQLVIIWKKNSVWHLLFRSKQKSIFSGHISGSRKIKNIKKFRFSKEDSLNINEIEIDFSLNTTRRKIKAIDFEVSKNSTLTFDFRVNQQRKIEIILLLVEIKKPRKIPFSIK